MKRQSVFYVAILFVQCILILGLNGSTQGQVIMDINQTISDGAQKNTIAFDGLAFAEAGNQLTQIHIDTRMHIRNPNNYTYSDDYLVVPQKTIFSEFLNKMVDEF
jgi:hypothetical protein